MAEVDGREVDEGAGDQLAAVVLHVLITDPRETLTLEQVVRACERDPELRDDLQSTHMALLGLVADGLAELEGQRFRATRAALRGHQLSF